MYVKRETGQTHQKLAGALSVLCGQALPPVEFARASVLDCGSPLPLSVPGDIQSGRGLPQSKTYRGERKPNVFRHKFDAFAREEKIFGEERIF